MINHRFHCTIKFRNCGNVSFFTLNKRKVFSFFTTFFALFMSWHKTNSQGIYYPIPEDSSVVWQMQYEFIDPFTCHEKYYYNYRLINDTSIQGLNYKKIYIQNTVLNINQYGPVGCSPLHPVDGYCGAFRQDSLAKKCFLVMPGDTTENLIYDFNLNVGDTLNSINLDTLNCFYTYYIVISIDSVSINNNFHIRQKFNCTYEIIEGVGSPDNPFLSIWGTNSLLCMNRDTIVYYSDGGPNCGLNMIKNDHKLGAKFCMYNNKSNEISLSNNERIMEIKIYAIDGKEVLKDEPRINVYSLKENVLLNNNLYIIKILTESGYIINKLIMN